MLTLAQVKGLRSPGKYLDQHGLYLIVEGAEKRYWCFRYRRGGRERLMSFGNADVITLGGARKLHLEARELLSRNIDPLDAKRAAETKQKPSARHFNTVARLYIEAHEAGWRSVKHRAQWRQSLAKHVAPVLGDLPVDQITVNDILTVLQPLWSRRAQTASRLRGRIELVLDYAKARGWRQGENPAAWRGNLKALLPPPGRVHQVKHLPALPWRECPEFMSKLSARLEDGMGARALAFLILTACRSGEVRGARWDEIDFEARVWTVPAERMKANREHRVPLSDAAMNILLPLSEIRPGSLVFFSRAGNEVPMSDMSLLSVLKRMGLSGTVTTHGFRSSFRDWCADHSHPADLAEAALAHVNGNGTVAAYLRTDRLEQRRGLMQAWANYLLCPEVALAA